MEKNFLAATSTRLSHDTRISGIPQARISPWNCSIEREPRVPLSSSLCSQHFIVPISGSITRERGIDTCRNPTSILLLVKLGEKKKKNPKRIYRTNEKYNFSNESLFLKFYTDWKKKGGDDPIHERSIRRFPRKNLFDFTTREAFECRQGIRFLSNLEN